MPAHVSARQPPASIARTLFVIDDSLRSELAWDPLKSDFLEVRRATVQSKCASQTENTYVACVVQAVMLTLEESAHPVNSDASSHLATSFLGNLSAGSCAARVATVLSLLPVGAFYLDAVILRDHVVLGLRGHDGVYFETLEGGRQISDLELRRHRMPPSGKPIRVDAEGFLPYYLDNLAARLAEAGRSTDAERALQQGLSLAPRAGRLHYNYGTLLLDEGRFKDAEKHLDLAIRYEWDDADAWVNRGVALSKLGKTSKALRCFDVALAKEPQNGRALANRDALRRAK